MDNLLKEGGSRPLPAGAPISPARPAPTFVLAALASYPIAYLYVRWVLLEATYYSGKAIFALLFVLWVEAFARACRRRAAAETPLWAGGLLLLSLLFPLYGAQGGALLVLWQVLAWHLFAVWYVLARCGMLAAGHSGSTSFLDAVSGLLRLPFGHFTLRVRTLWQAAAARRARRDPARRQGLVLVASLLAGAAVCAFAWGQLAVVDARFAALPAWLDRWWRWPDGDQWLCFLLSLPVGAWLYGLVAGALCREVPPCPEQRFYARLAPLQRLPGLTVCLVPGALCVLYGVFFALQGWTWVTARGQLTAPAASRYAVVGFWELCRVQLLNFALLAVLRYFGPQWLERRLPRVLAALLCLFGLAFAGLAFAKLATYIHLYGYTPRRVVSGWFVGVLALWALLALAWVWGRGRLRGGAARLAVYGAVVAFLLLSAVNVDRQVLRANIRRYAAGVDAELDVQVLRECGLDTWSDADKIQYPQGTYARWLIEAGWFEGRTEEEIHALYFFARGQQTVRADLGRGEALCLRFDAAGRCTGASVAAAP